MWLVPYWYYKGCKQACLFKLGLYYSFYICSHSSSISSLSFLFQHITSLFPLFNRLSFSFLLIYPPSPFLSYNIHGYLYKGETKLSPSSVIWAFVLFVCWSQSERVIDPVGQRSFSSSTPYWTGKDDLEWAYYHPLGIRTYFTKPEEWTHTGSVV